MSAFNLQRKYIYIHIPKTAGTSMEKALNCGAGHQTVYLFKDLIEGKHIYPLNWSEVRCFAFVRNPYTRFQSLYKHCLRAGHIQGTFDEFSQTHTEVKKGFTAPQHSFICDPHNYNIQAGFIGKFENLEEDWATALQFIGEPVRPLSWTNKSLDTIQAEYTDDIIERVNTYYALDFELFEYDTKLTF